jgi:hypothetical protein
MKEMFSSTSKYPITKPPEIVYGGGGKVIGYYLEDSLGNRRYIKVEEEKKPQKEAEQDISDGLVLFLFKEHTSTQLNNMLKSEEFIDIKFEINLALSMYDILSRYLKDKKYL